jgi:hypothetical protein
MDDTGRVVVRFFELGAPNQYGAGRVVERKGTLFLPPDGPFDDDDVHWEGPSLFRETDKYKYAWIPASRLKHFREGLWEKFQRTYYLRNVPRATRTSDLPGKPVNVERWSRLEQWHCECGPSSTRVSADEMLERSQRTRLRSAKGRISQRRMDWMIYFLENNLVPAYADKAAAYECRGPSTVQVNAAMKLVGEAISMVKDEDIDIIEPGRRANIDAFGSDVITEPVSASVTYLEATHEVKSLELLELCPTTTNHTHVTCSCRAGQKGDLCAPKLAAMMKIDKRLTLTALGAHVKREDDRVSSPGSDDDGAGHVDDITTSGYVHMAEETGEVETLSPRRMRVPPPKASAVEIQRRERVEAVKLLERIASILKTEKEIDANVVTRVLGVSKEAEEMLSRREEFRAIQAMLDHVHAGSGVATGLGSRGNRSSIDSGKRNSLSREHSFAEFKSHPRKVGRPDE